jgi:hypothetical protein
MTTDQFEKTFEARVDLCRRVLISKNTEYARGQDKLHNFKEAASMEGQSPEQALRGMLLKHWQSLRDLCNDLDRDIIHPISLWDEKIGDSLNYLFLLDALVKERYRICLTQINAQSAEEP